MSKKNKPTGKIEPSPLPQTYLDHARLCRPDAIEAIFANAKKLEDLGFDGKFLDVEDFGKHNISTQIMNDELERVGKAMIRGLGGDPDTMKETSEYWIDLSHRHPMTQQHIFQVDTDYQVITRFILSGEKTFLLEDGLANRLLHTDMSAPCELVRLPYPTIMMVTRSAEIIDAAHPDKNDKNFRKGTISAFISEFERPTGRTLNLIIIHTNGYDNLMFIKRSLALSDGTTIEDALMTDWAERGQENTNPVTGQPASEEIFKTGLYPLIRVFLNAVMYMSSEKAIATREITNSAQYRRDTKNYSNRKHVTLGTGLTPVAAPGTMSIGRNRIQLQNHQSDTKVKAVLVMGHYRNQAHGPGRALRKTIWIEPFWRGDDIAGISNSPHRLH